MTLRRLASADPVRLGDPEDEEPARRRRASAKLRSVPGARAPEHEEPGAPPVRRVLIADDDDDLRAALAMALEMDGWTVIEARDGEEAVAAAREARPSVILLDCRMPRKTGQEVYRELRAGGLSIPVLLVTAGIDVERIAAELGVPHFLGKPFGLDELYVGLGAAAGPRPEPS